MTVTRLALQRRERGFALATTLGFTVILALAALAIASSARFNGAVVRDSVDLLQVRTLLRNASEIALADLSIDRERPAFPRDGGAVSFDLEAGAATVAIEDERGKLDLNAAEPRHLAALFAQVAREAGLIAPPVAPLIRAREERPFFDVSELQERAGVSVSMVGRLRAVATTSTQSATVNPLRASPYVLHSIDGITPALIAQIEAARSRGIPPPNLGDAQRYVALDNGPFYTVRTTVRLRSGPSLSEAALVKVEAGGENGFRVSVLRRY